MQLSVSEITKRLGPGSWPTIIACHEDQGQIELELHVPGDLVEFAGHFPQQAVVPGILQIHWAVKLAKVCFADPGSNFSELDTFAAMRGIKFNSMVLPEARVKLTLSYSADQQRLKFSFYDAQHKYSSGDLRFSGDRS